MDILYINEEHARILISELLVSPNGGRERNEEARPPSTSNQVLFNVEREKGAVMEVRVNSVTIVRKKFSEVYGAFRALYSSLSPFSAIFMFLATADGKKTNWWGVVLKRHD